MNNKAQFTPGPWKAVPDKSRNMYTWYVEGAKGVVPTIARLSLIDACEEIEGNANLIAAAPVMYEALQAMLEGILYTRGASMSEDRWRTLTTIAKQAIAQAEGR